MDEWDAMGHGMKIDRRASDWGNVSLRIGGFFLVMAPVQLFFNDFYWAIGIHHAAPNEISQVQIVAPIVIAMFLGLIVFAITAGFRGLALARATNYPIALALGGLLVSFVDLFLYIGLGINLLAIVRVIN
jgi:uncharacterized sodium:solute symporter family permease YidK